MPLWKLIFYGFSAVSVAYLTFRMWRNSRAPKQRPFLPNDTAAGLGTGSVSTVAPPLPKPPVAPPVPAASEILPLPPVKPAVPAAAAPPAIPTSVAPGILRTAPAAAATAVATTVAATAKSAAAGNQPTAQTAARPLAAGPQTYSASRESRAHRGVAGTERSLFHDDTTSPLAANPLPVVEPHQVPVHGTSDYQYGFLTPTFAALLPETAARQQETKRDLKSAGRYEPHALENFSATRYLLMMAGLIVFGVLLLLVPPRFEGVTIFALAAATIGGWALPRVFLKSAAANRLIDIERAMPDMLDMLNMCVSQGLTVQDSLGRVSEQMKPVYPALAQELQIVSDQAKIGSLDQAMENFSDRIDLPEVHSFTSLVTQTERMGTSVSEALSNYSDTMRENLRQRADEKANRATFRLLFPTVLCLMPAVFMILLGPAVVELSDFFTGRGRQILGRNREVVEGVNSRQTRTQDAPRIP